MSEGQFDPEFFQRIMAGDGASAGVASIETRIYDFFSRLDTILVDLYGQKLEISTEPEAPVISLADVPPDDREERRRQLEGKKLEYTTRYKNDSISGNIKLKSLLHTLYKREALVLLLKFGSLNTYAYGRAVAQALNTMAYGEETAEKMGHTPLSYEFTDACGIIHDYVLTGGKSVEGGTGLPAIKPRT